MEGGGGVPLEDETGKLIVSGILPGFLERNSDLRVRGLGSLHLGLCSRFFPLGGRESIVRMRGRICGFPRPRQAQELCHSGSLLVCDSQLAKDVSSTSQASPGRRQNNLHLLVASRS